MPEQQVVDQSVARFHHLTPPHRYTIWRPTPHAACGSSKRTFLQQPDAIIIGSYLNSLFIGVAQCVRLCLNGANVVQDEKAEEDAMEAVMDKERS